VPAATLQGLERAHVHPQVGRFVCKIVQSSSCSNSGPHRMLWTTQALAQSSEDYAGLDPPRTEPCGVAALPCCVYTFLWTSRSGPGDTQPSGQCAVASAFTAYEHVHARSICEDSISRRTSYRWPAALSCPPVTVGSAIFPRQLPSSFTDNT
jgi:hypothetical protein